MPELRRQPRVVYDARVSLRAPGRENSVVARVQNLSASGIFITGPDVPAAGTEVMCRLLLNGERRTLKGRVAWVRPPAVSRTKGAGAGIQFVGLSARDLQMLHELASPPANDHLEPVDVWFEGLKAPIRSHAVVRPDGLRIATKLPFLRLQSPVRVSFVQNGAQQVRTGTLDAVTLEPSQEDGIPRLQLSVSTPTLESAVGTIEVYEPPSGRTPAEGALLQEPRTLVDPKAIVPPPPSSARFVDDDRTQRIRVVPEPATPVVVGSREGSGPTRAAPARRRPVATAALLLGAAAVGAGITQLAWQRAAPVVSRAPAVEAAEPASGPIVEALPSAPAAEPDPPPAVEAAPAGEPARPSPFTVDHEGALAALHIPLSGTPRRVDHFPLADPPGIAITLPRALLRARAGVHSAAAPFANVHVRRAGASTQVRVFHAPGKVAQVAIERDGLRVTLRPKRR